MLPELSFKMLKPVQS